MVKRVWKNWSESQSGAAAVEYSVIVFAMFGALIPAFLYVASGMGVKFASITDYFNLN